jgi:hypothetical protein
MLNSSKESCRFENFSVIIDIKIRIVDDAYSALVLDRDSDYYSDKLQISFDKAFGSIKRIYPNYCIFGVECFKIVIDLYATFLALIAFDSSD